MVFSNHIQLHAQADADSDRTLGELLKKKKLITDDQLTRALDEQSNRWRQFEQSVHLGLILIEQQYVTEQDLLKAVNDHYQLSLRSFPGNFDDILRRQRLHSRSRRPLFRFPIWLQLSLAITLIVTLTIFLLDFFVLSRQKQRLYEQTLKVGMVSLTYFDANARIPLLEDNILQLNTLIKNAVEVEGLLYAIIVDQRREIKAHTDRSKIGTEFKQIEPIAKVEQVGNTRYFEYTLPGGQQVLNLSRPIVFKDKQLGEVHVGVSLDFIEQDIHRERLSILWMTVLIIAIGITIAIYFGVRFSRPISQLVKATEDISQGKYQHHIDLTRRDELGNLAFAFNRMNEELWLKSLMQKSFGKYVGSQILDLIMENPEDTWLQGQTNEATILFADIRGFTSYSESKAPKVIVDELNQFFEIANRAILNHDGYIDKFIGDGVLAVFGVPFYQKDHIKNAVGAAFEMQQAFRSAGTNGNVLLASIGIGIHTGLVVSGNIGSPVKMEYTVIGDSVNVASRISEIAAPGEIIISSNIYERIRDFIEVEPLRPHKIKGRSKPIKIYRSLKISERHHGQWS
jgi:adenylate cyclase